MSGTAAVFLCRSRCVRSEEDICDQDPETDQDQDRAAEVFRVVPEASRSRWRRSRSR